MLRKLLSGGSRLGDIVASSDPAMRGASSGSTACTRVQFIALICLVYIGPISR